MLSVSALTHKLSVFVRGKRVAFIIPRAWPYQPAASRHACARRDPGVKAAPAGEEHWQGIVAGRVVWLARYPGVGQSSALDGEDVIRWRVQPGAEAGFDPDPWLRAYLRLDVDLPAIYADWQ